MSWRDFSVGGVMVLALLVLGGMSNRESIERDCKEMGMFRNSNGVYVCELRKAQK